MANTIRAFDYEVGNGEVSIVPRRNWLHPSCASPDELDAHVRLLKEDLDAVAVRAKAALTKELAKPLFGAS